MIYSVSEVGDMIDFLKTFPFVSVEQYRWELSAPLIDIMRVDNTHLIHLSKNEAERKKRDKNALHIGDIGNGTFRNDLGGSVF